MPDRQAAFEKAIAETLTQVHAELVRLYTDGDVGTVIINVGKAQMRVKAQPERISEPISLETK